MAEIDEADLADFNLTVLRRIDSQIESILFSGGHVSVYEFDAKDHKVVKGPLFVLKRNNPDAKYIFLVLNRLQIKTLVEEFSAKMKFENTSKYLLYQTENDGSKAINGIWFYDEKKKDEFYSLAKGILAEFTSGIDLVNDQPEETNDDSALSPAVSDMFRNASLAPLPTMSPYGPYPVTRPGNIGYPTTNVRVDVNTLFASFPQPRAAVPQSGMKINVGDLFTTTSRAQTTHQSRYSTFNSLPPLQALNISTPVSTRQAPPFSQANNANPNSAVTPPAISKPNVLLPTPSRPLALDAPSLSPVSAVLSSDTKPAKKKPVRPVVKSPASLFMTGPQVKPITSTRAQEDDHSRSATSSAGNAADSVLTSNGSSLNTSTSAAPPGFTPDGSPSITRARGNSNPSKPRRADQDRTHVQASKGSAPVQSLLIPAKGGSASVAPAKSTTTTATSQLTKHQLRDAIVQLLQNDAFIDAIYGAYSNSVGGKK